MMRWVGLGSVSYAGRTWQSWSWTHSSNLYVLGSSPEWRGMPEIRTWATTPAICDSKSLTEGFAIDQRRLL